VRHHSHHQYHLHSAYIACILALRSQSLALSIALRLPLKYASHGALPPSAAGCRVDWRGCGLPRHRHVRESGQRPERGAPPPISAHSHIPSRPVPPEKVHRISLCYTLALTPMTTRNTGGTQVCPGGSNRSASTSRSQTICTGHEPEVWVCTPVNHVHQLAEHCAAGG